MSSAAPIPSHSLILRGRPVGYTIRHAPRARAPYLSIRPETGLIAHVPFGKTPLEAQTVIHRHAAWVLRHLARWEQRASEIPKRWPYGPALPYRGQDHAVTMQEGARARVIRMPEGTLLVTGRPPTIPRARRALVAWYRRRAVRWAQIRVEHWSRRTGISYRHIRIGDQRTRWGSCSPTGSLSFNYRLVMAPPEVFDYVVIHELMHRQQPNHSRRFWALVERHCPAYRERVAWLRRYGPFLGVPLA